LSTSLTAAQDALILNRQNHDLLCVEGDSGNEYVDPTRMYSMLFIQAGIPSFIIEKAASEGISAERAIREEGFPPDDFIEGESRILAGMRSKKNEVVGNFLSDIYTTEFDTQGYVREDSSPAADRFVFDLSPGKVQRFVIRCIDVVSVPDYATRINEFVAQFAKGFRLRKDIDELTLIAAAPTAGSLKERIEGVRSAKLATLSITRDYEANANTVSAIGAAGFQVGRFLPFVAYHFEDSEGNDDDVEVVSPGIIYDEVFPSQLGDPHVTANLFLPVDVKNNAQRAALSASAEPSFRLGRDLVTLGAYTAPFDGPLWILPTIAPLAEVSHVIDAGTNEQFEKAENFFGIGTRVGIKMKLPTVPIVDSATLSVDYEVLRLFAGDQSTFDMFEVSLGWTPKDVPYFGISISYRNGENELTFQNEQNLNIGLGARF
jgi:hypothetical protein